MSLESCSLACSHVGFDYRSAPECLFFCRTIQIDSQDVPPELGRAVLSAMADADGTDGNRLPTQTVSQYLGNDVSPDFVACPMYPY